MFKKTAALVLVLLVALPAAARTVEVDETRPAASDGEVSVELLAGSVTVIGWARDEVNVTGTINDEYEELEVEADGGDVSIEVDVAEGEHHELDGGADLTIRVPSGAQFDIEAISADITIDDVTGAVEIEAISGDIECRGGMEEIDIECISGDVSVATTAELRRATVETVSGSVELRGALSRGARVSVESVNGSVTLRLPASTSAEFEISTFNGAIKNDFGPRAKKASEYLPSMELNFSMGSGDARVSVDAFNGTVRLVED